MDAFVQHVKDKIAKKAKRGRSSADSPDPEQQAKKRKRQNKVALKSEEDSQEIVPPIESGESNLVKRLKLYKTAKAAGEIVKDRGTSSGIVYVGHLPHGFYEDQLLKYFSQFGAINQLRLARSRKTGRCKGFAFIEFKHEEVAEIVAEAMNNYLFFEKLLVCKYIPKEKVHPKTFSGWVKGMPLACDKTRIKHNAELSQEELEMRNQRRLAKLRHLKEELEEGGICYKFPESVGDLSEERRVTRSGGDKKKKKRRKSSPPADD